MPICPAPPDLHDMLDSLHSQYASQPAMVARLRHNLESVLPASLVSARQALAANSARRQVLSEGSEEFKVAFLERDEYFYLQYPEVFIAYDGDRFRACSQDDIQHEILSKISEGGALRPWKHKVTRALIKEIRGRSPLDRIPESATIQRILSWLSPSFFRTRDEAKYFLTVIGDGLRASAQQEGLVYLTPPALRELVRSLSVEIFTHTGSGSALHGCKFKHHDHAYESCRLLPIPVHATASSLDLSSIPRMSLDVLCVASHYSKRFGGADAYLRDHCHDLSLNNFSLQLANTTPEGLVTSFISDCIEQCPQRKIYSKNMIFVWKQYLSRRSLPAVVFQCALKEMLKAKLSYCAESDAFIGVTSPHVPLVAEFLKFWTDTIVEDAQAQDEELEMDELQTLFRHWAREDGASLGTTDPCIAELIRHFYPDVDIADGRVIVNVRCKLWDKQGTVRDAVDLYLARSPKDESMTLSAAYSAYVSMASPVRARVSKRFFEKQAREVLGSAVDQDGVISSDDA